jgi:hypothetical protein
MTERLSVNGISLDQRDRKEPVGSGISGNKHIIGNNTKVNLIHPHFFPDAGRGIYMIQDG